MLPSTTQFTQWTTTVEQLEVTAGFEISYQEMTLLIGIGPSKEEAWSRDWMKVNGHAQVIPDFPVWKLLYLQRKRSITGHSGTEWPSWTLGRSLSPARNKGLSGVGIVDLIWVLCFLKVSPLPLCSKKKSIFPAWEVQSTDPKLSPGPSYQCALSSGDISAPPKVLSWRGGKGLSSYHLTWGGAVQLDFKCHHQRLIPVIHSLKEGNAQKSSLIADMP